jgi:hypothetical protein
MSRKNFRPTKTGRPTDYDDELDNKGYDIKNVRRSHKRKIAKFKDYRDVHGDS